MTTIKTSAVDDTPADSPTELTSDTLEYDAEGRRAVFVGNVHVLDDRLDLKADKMTVEFDDDNQLKRIDATGNVVVSRQGSVAMGGQAVYEVEKSLITLTEYPVLVRGLNRMSGAERIMYNHDSGKFTTDGGRTTSVFYPNDGEREKAIREFRRGTKRSPVADNATIQGNGD